jgi:2-polyprenyl-3-methyl-5-hydroxy-6-metoxy-1,4-benzoquinol methylase
MTLARELEPEVMDTDEDAREYDAMDHAAVNAQFAVDLLADLGVDAAVRILDLGTGTAQIPIELCRRAANIRITGVDAAESMIALAGENVVAAGLTDRIDLLCADAKALTSAPYDATISNSILHHIAEPRAVVATAIRHTAPGGLLFHRDLARPRDNQSLQMLVDTYAGNATLYQQKLFADSLRAALTVDEMRGIVAEFDFSPETVQMTSDRHWTWSARRLPA